MATKVLCLDDDLAVAKLIARLVESCGHKAVALTDPFEVTAHLSDPTVKAVLSDLVMPLRDGISVLSEVQTLRPDVRRVLVTAAPHGFLVLDAVRTGRVQQVVAKPPSRADIGAAVAGLD